MSGQEIYQLGDVFDKSDERDVEPDVIQVAGVPEEALDDELDKMRIKQYMDNRGLFLIHDWKSSNKEDQIADIVIRLHEHLDAPRRASLLEEGRISSVKYELGRNFSRTSITSYSSEDHFSLTVSAYHPMLCLAKVTFNDKSDPIYLSRYINFPTKRDFRESPWSAHSRLTGSPPHRPPH